MSKNPIETILNTEYDCSICSAPVEAVMWALDKIDDVSCAKKYLKEINRIRTKHGVIPVYVPYGHRCF